MKTIIAVVVSCHLSVAFGQVPALLQGSREAYQAAAENARVQRQEEILQYAAHPDAAKRELDADLRQMFEARSTAARINGIDRASATIATLESGGLNVPDQAELADAAVKLIADPAKLIRAKGFSLLSATARELGTAKLDRMFAAARNEVDSQKTKEVSTTRDARVANQQIIAAIGGLGNEEAAAALLKHLSEPNFKAYEQQLLTAIGNCPCDAAIDGLTAFAKKSDDSDVKASIELLVTRMETAKFHKDSGN